MAGVIAEHSQPAFCSCLPVQWPIYQMTVLGLDTIVRVICGDLNKPLKHTVLVKAGHPHQEIQATVQISGMNLCEATRTCFNHW